MYHKTLKLKNSKDLKQSIATIPPCQRSFLKDYIFDLSDNELYTRSASDLAIAFTHLPANLTEVKLHDNGLGRMTGTDLAIVLATLPSVRILDLQDNALGKIRGERCDIIHIYGSEKDPSIDDFKDVVNYQYIVTNEGLWYFDYKQHQLEKLNFLPKKSLTALFYGFDFSKSFLPDKRSRLEYDLS